MEGDAGRVIAASPRRYTSVRDYCQMRIASLPSAAIALYRGRVDAQAQRLFDGASDRHDAAALRTIVEQYFASSVGDDALLALGDLALEGGEHGEARAWWEKLIPTPPQSVPREQFERSWRTMGCRSRSGSDCRNGTSPTVPCPPWPIGFAPTRHSMDATRAALVTFWNARGLMPSRLAYPDSDLDLAGIRARLVLASILEGSWERATDELTGLRSLHATAHGRLGGTGCKLRGCIGRDACQGQRLAAACRAARMADLRRARCRARTWGPVPLEPDMALWPDAVTLPKPPVTDSFYPSPRVGETKNELLSHHPIVVGNLVAVNTQHEIRVYDLRTGNPAWGGDAVIFRPAEPVVERTHGSASTLGVARFTMTAYDGFLYARMGDAVTTRPEDSVNYQQPSYLVGLDLAGEDAWHGRRFAPKRNGPSKARPSPMAGASMSPMRHGTRPQSHVACYDASTGRQLWRQFVASARLLRAVNRANARTIC